MPIGDRRTRLRSGGEESGFGKVSCYVIYVSVILTSEPDFYLFCRGRAITLVSTLLLGLLIALG